MNTNPTKRIIYILVAVILVTVILGAFTYWYLKRSTSITTKPTPISSGQVLESETPSLTTVSIFLIAQNDNGKAGKLVGCGDSVVAVERQVASTDAILKATIEELLSMKDQFYTKSGLYNAYYQTDLKLANVNIENGVATIKLTGTFSSSGTCDDPRFKAQVEETAKQFPTVKEVKIYINDKTIEEITSQK